MSNTVVWQENIIQQVDALPYKGRFNTGSRNEVLLLVEVKLYDATEVKLEFRGVMFADETKIGRLPERNNQTGKLENFEVIFDHDTEDNGMFVPVPIHPGITDLIVDVKFGGGQNGYVSIAAAPSRRA